MAREFLRFFAAILATAALAGCAQVGPPMPPSLELPKAVTDLRATRKGDHVTLIWTAPTKITEGGVIRHLGPTRICRSQNIPMAECDIVAGQLPPTAANKTTDRAYVDRLPGDLIRLDANSLISYAVEVLNTDGRSAGLSNPVAIPLLATLPAPEKLEAQVTPQGVLLSWLWPAAISPVPSLEYKLRIYRRNEAGKDESKVGEVALNENGEAQFLDPGPEWEKTFNYSATWVTVANQPGKSEIEVEGDESPEMKVSVHDTFPPATPAGLQAVFSSVGQPNFIDLTWAPNTDADLVGYNVYRRELGGTSAKINSELAKIPTYRDRDVQPGKKYFYSVSAVDVRGNETEHSPEASESVPWAG